MESAIKEQSPNFLHSHMSQLAVLKVINMMLK